MSQFSDIHRETTAVYERNAHGWDERRPRSLIEKPWLDKLLNSMAPGSSVLDVGCGAGEPISRYVLKRGFSLTGVDSSPKMIEICKTRFPDQSWIVMDMRELSLGERFAAIIAWDSFFHLSPDEQRQVLQRFLTHLDSRGALLLTVGHESGEVLGVVEGEDVYHSSLEPQEYEHILRSRGLGNIEMTLQDKSCGDRTVLLARP
ncbi:MAG TPA: SAM-dependent methyltransferase [Gammaproteobacteria bacterium]|nr:class I SAM-dependent methyltransferase [Gammaproteobacteria bacterium]MDP6733714.1 class I SAM-dependent methyltransferase [Gammaproteobacteria bacterium]HAJ76298.1 SAM-dependent methyltransferase [Gammaproteobacteria bacterium]